MGSGKADEDGNISKPNLSIGDTVLYSKYAGVEFEVIFPFSLDSFLLFYLSSSISNKFSF